jgi:hypothetical protein
MKATAGPGENVWARKAVERQHEADPYAGVSGSSSKKRTAPPAAAASKPTPKSAVTTSAPASSSSTSSIKKSSDGKSARSEKDLAERRSKLAVTNPAATGHRHADPLKGQLGEKEEKGKEEVKGKKQKREEKKQQMEQALVRQQEVLATYQRNLKASVESIMQDNDDLEFRYVRTRNGRQRGGSCQRCLSLHNTRSAMTMTR